MGETICSPEKRDIIALARHVMAMTTEDLRAKWEIAAELAYMDSEIARLTAEVAELRAAQTPRPMAEAPRDGTEIMAYRKYHKGWIVVYCPNGGDWWSMTTGVGTYVDGNFAGWLPLPPAPINSETKP